jgi:hypothetical protein
VSDGSLFFAVFSLKSLCPLFAVAFWVVIAIHGVLYNLASNLPQEKSSRTKVVFQMRRSAAIFSCILLSVCFASGQQRHLSQRLTNQDVIDMVALGLSDDLIVDKIHATAATDFDTSVAGLKALKLNRVSDAVIRAMINPSGTPSTSIATVGSSAASNTGISLEAGMYIVRAGTPTEMDPEVVNWQTGGVAKKTITLSIVKGDLNGKVAKPRSPLQTASPLEFLIKTVEGTSVTEYQLLRLHEKGDRREFRSVTGGVLHQSGGALRDELPFDSRKIGSSLWRVRLGDLPTGEYGFLAPAISSVSISASGKMYTFGVTAGSPTQSNSNQRQTGQVDVSDSTEQVFSAATIGVLAEGNPTVRRDGVMLSSVAHDGPADRAGIRAGDVILAVNDHYLFTIEELNREIHRHKPGTEVTVRYRRYTTINASTVLIATAN